MWTREWIRTRQHYEDSNVTEIMNVDEDEDIFEGSYVLDTGSQQDLDSR
jgi:hypothetical protein